MKLNCPYMNSQTKILLSFAFFLEMSAVTAASINELLFEDNRQNISMRATRQWEFDQASWEVSLKIRDTANISSFSKLDVSKEEAKIIVPNEPALKEVEFAAVVFTPINKESDDSKSGINNSRNKNITPAVNLLENIGAETTEQFTKRGLSLDLFFPQLKMGSSEPL